jgi:hypothetical protein
VSSCEKPTCSARFLVLPVVSKTDVARDDKVRVRGSSSSSWSPSQPSKNPPDPTPTPPQLPDSLPFTGSVRWVDVSRDYNNSQLYRITATLDPNA